MSDKRVAGHRITRLMETAELAEVLGVPVYSLYAWKAKGTGPKAIKVGKYLRYRPADVEAWLEQQADDRRTAV